jgi:hypothetical protein
MPSAHPCAKIPATPVTPAARARRFGRLVLLVLLAWLLAWPAAGGAQAAPPLAAVAAVDPVEARRLRYLEIELRQLGQVEKKDLGPMRLGAGVVAAAALAEAGRGTSDASHASDTSDVSASAVRWAEATLEACGPRHFGGLCERALLPLQRTLLQYPGALPPALRERLRAAASVSARPPTGAARTDPWGFKETENGRLLTATRSLVAQVVAGTPGSPEAAAWGEHLTAFLRARDRAGWYEGQSPGYMGLSITYLLHLADHAPQPALRELAARQLDVLFGAWAQEQVAGFPAGVQSRAYSHWVLGTDLTPWRAWAWLVGGLTGSAGSSPGSAGSDSSLGSSGAPGSDTPEGITFLDWPDLAVSRYRVPAPVARLLAERRRQAPYEIRARRVIDLGHRRDLDTALYTYATPDYVLGSAQAVDGLRFGVSGGQEIQATLFAECAAFAPLYLWSRVDAPRAERWRSWAKQDLAMGHRNVVLARLGAGSGSGAAGSPGSPGSLGSLGSNTKPGSGAIGHAYLSPPWSRPEPAGDNALVARCGDTYVALVTAGGWEVAEAPRRFAGLYGAPGLAGSWAAVPRRQPADIALEVGRRAEHGDFAAWRERAARLALAVAPAPAGPDGSGGSGGSGSPGGSGQGPGANRQAADGELRFTATDGTLYTFVPGQRATVAGAPLAPRAFPLLAGPFVASTRAGEWTFSLAGVQVRLEPDAAWPRSPDPATDAVRPVGRKGSSP